MLHLVGILFPHIDDAGQNHFKFDRNSLGQQNIRNRNSFRTKNI